MRRWSAAGRPTWISPWQTRRRRQSRSRTCGVACAGMGASKTWTAAVVGLGTDIALERAAAQMGAVHIFGGAYGAETAAHVVTGQARRGLTHGVFTPAARKRRSRRSRTQRRQNRASLPTSGRGPSAASATTSYSSVYAAGVRRDGRLRRRGHRRGRERPSRPTGGPVAAVRQAVEEGGPGTKDGRQNCQTRLKADHNGSGWR